MTTKFRAAVRVRYFNTRLGVWLYWRRSGVTWSKAAADTFCTLQDRASIERALRYMPGRVRLELLPKKQEAVCA